MKNQKCALTVLLVVMLLLQGCYFPQHKVPNAGNIAGIGGGQRNGPIVFLDYKNFGGLPGTTTDQVVVSQVEEESVFNIVRSTGLFSDIIFDEYEKDRADLTLEIHVYRYTNPGKTLAAALISGLSMALIPTSYDEVCIVQTRIIDKQGSFIAEYKNEDAITMRFWLFIYFFAEKTYPNYVKYNSIKDSLIHISTNKNWQAFVSRPKS